MFVDIVLALVYGLGNAVLQPVKLTTVPRLEFLDCVSLCKLLVSKKISDGLLNVQNVFLLVRFVNVVVAKQTGLERLKSFVENQVQVIYKNAAP